MSLSCVWPEAHAVAESCLRRASTKRLQFAKIRIVREICKRAFRGGREGGVYNIGVPNAGGGGLLRFRELLVMIHALLRIMRKNSLFLMGFG